MYVEEGDAAARDAVFDDRLQQIGAALEADPTLGRLAFGLAYGRPDTSIEPVAGAPAIKSATLTVNVAYESEALQSREVSGRASLPHPPKSSSIMSSRSTPRSNSMLITDWFMIGGPHR